MRLRLISCELFANEIRTAAAQSINQVQIELLPKSLHQFTNRESRLALQGMVDQTDRTRFQAVLLLCGSCQRSLTGLNARSVPMVLPRAKTCISLLLEPPRPDHASSTSFVRADFQESEMATPNFPYSSKASDHWMVPVNAPPLGDVNLAPPAGPWSWRARFGRVNCSRKPRRELGGSQPVISSLTPSSWERPRQSTLLQSLMDGYWSYDEFLVVPVGCRVVARAGSITAEDIPI
jgi:hypothetical protein